MAFFAALLFVASFSAASELEIVRQNIVRFITGTGADTTQQYVRQALVDLSNTAQSYLTQLDTSGKWSSIDYTQPLGQEPWKAGAHYGRLLTMAEAFATPGNSLYHSQTLLNGITRGLKFIHTHVHRGSVLGGNWWYWDIGVPKNYGQTLLLVYSHLDSAVLANGIDDLDYLKSLSKTLNVISPNGDDVTRSNNDLYFAVLSNNIDYLESAKQRVDLNFVFSSVPGSSGMRPDYSLHHHEYQLHTGSYGVQFAHDGARYLYFTQNTSYAPSPIRKQRFMDYVAYGICWSTYNRYFTPSVIGRSITRSGADASEGLFAMLILSTMPGTQKELFLKASSKMIETWTTRLPVAIAATLSGLSQEKEWPSGFRHYPYSDLSIKRNSSYFATLKTLSPRTSAGEYVNTEGRKSWHLSDGFLYLVLKGNEYAANHFWPTFNWTRFPGTTIEQKPYPMPAGNAILGTGKVDFSGATSIDDIGVTAMQFGGVVSTALPGLETSLQAKKSWFFFGKEIVCIGSSINCSSDSLVETVIDQRRLNSENSPLIIDNTTKSTSLDGEKKYPSAKHIYTDSIGYFFPESSIIYVSRLKQNGRWSELGQGDTVLRQSPVQTIHINHGRRPLNGSYAYAMLPAISQSELAAYSLNPDISILANNDSVHAVYNKAKSTTGIVFWKACSYNGLTVNLPCIILKKTLPGAVALSVSRPEHISANLSISIKENLLDTLIKFTSDSGRSYRFDLLRNGNSNSQIRVSITDSITGLPISAAACSLKSSILYTAVTDTLGRFGTALDSGKYTLSINKPGYKRILNYPITLLNSDTLKINLRLSPLSIVSIKNEDNKILLSPGSFFTPKASIEYNDGSIADASELILNWSFYPSGSAIYDTKSNQIKASTVPSSLKAICSYNNFTDTMWITIADRYSISPSADAYVQGGTTSSTNYGKQTVLVIKKSTDPNYTRYSYFKFTLPALSDLSLIDSVRFRLMGADTLKLAANLDAVIHSTDTNTWSEDSITWDRRPAFIRALDTAVLSYDVSKLYYWNITMAVRDAIAEKKSSITLAVASGREHSEWISFWSKEAAKSITLRSPMLELFLHPQLLSSADSAVNLMPEDILSVSPNPFNPSTFISFYTNNKNAPSTLTIHNIKGEKIWQYKASSGFSGKKSICWNGKNMYGKPVAAGLYYCTFVNGKNRKSTLLALVR